MGHTRKTVLTAPISDHRAIGEEIRVSRRRVKDRAATPKLITDRVFMRIE